MSDAYAAFVLAHEVSHVQGGNELTAYSFQTEYAIDYWLQTGSDELLSIAQGFTSPSGTSFVISSNSSDDVWSVNTTAIQEFLNAPTSPYQGWYTKSEFRKWKRDKGNNQTSWDDELNINGDFMYPVFIDYINVVVEYPWVCGC